MCSEQFKQKSWAHMCSEQVKHQTLDPHGLVVNFYIPHNRRTPLQAEEALGPISVPRGSCGVDPF
jgi:hypothetical protein